MTNRRKARILAMRMLYQHDIANIDPIDLLNDLKNEKNFNTETIAFATSIFSGTVAHVKEIDKILSDLSRNWPLKRMAFLDRNILRFAAYEILYVDEIPKSVSINEAIEISKQYGTDESSKFINGILDKVNKRSETESL